MNYEVILNKQIVKNIRAPGFAAAKKAAVAEFGRACHVQPKGTQAAITSPDFLRRMRAAGAKI